MENGIGNYEFDNLKAEDYLNQFYITKYLYKQNSALLEIINDNLYLNDLVVQIDQKNAFAMIVNVKDQDTYDENFETIEFDWEFILKYRNNNYQDIQIASCQNCIVEINIVYSKGDLTSQDQNFGKIYFPINHNAKNELKLGFQESFIVQRIQLPNPSSFVQVYQQKTDDYNLSDLDIEYNNLLLFPIEDNQNSLIPINAGGEYFIVNFYQRDLLTDYFYLLYYNKESYVFNYKIEYEGSVQQYEDGDEFLIQYSSTSFVFYYKMKKGSNVVNFNNVFDLSQVYINKCENGYKDCAFPDYTVYEYEIENTPDTNNFRHNLTERASQDTYFSVFIYNQYMFDGNEQSLEYYSSTNSKKSYSPRVKLVLSDKYIYRSDTPYWVFALVVFTNCITQPNKGTDDDPSLKPSKQITQSYSGTDYQMKLIYNSKGKYLSQAATNLGVSQADLGGILKVESSGNGFTASTGLMIIRFENHWFYKLYTDNGKDASKVANFNKYFKFDSTSSWKGHYYRKSTSSDWINFHGNQNLEWDCLQFAQSLDDTAAIQSASYGIAQIMGFNYKVLGFSTPQKMFIDMSGSIKSQLDGMFSFIKNNSKCYNALKATPTDYYNFAYCYNGSGQATTYGNLIKDASTSYKKITAAIGEDTGDNTGPTLTLASGDVISFQSSINIRSGAGTSYSAIGKSSVGQQALILSGPTSNNGYSWYKVELVSSGTQGYVAYSSGWFSAQYQIRTNDSVKTTTSVYLRSSPGGSSLGLLSSGTQAKVIGTPVVSGGYVWYPLKVSSSGSQGYSAMGNGNLQKI